MTNPNMDAMFIYVAGPYSPPPRVRAVARRKEIIDCNIQRANNAALGIIKRGHIPFVPHTLMKGWEDEHELSREYVMDVCQRWLEKCDALLFIGASPGAEAELRQAVVMRLLIYYRIDDVPDRGALWL